MTKAGSLLLLVLCSIAHAGAVEDAVERMNANRDANTHVEMVRPGVYYDPLHQQYLRIEESRQTPQRQQQQLKGSGEYLPPQSGGFVDPRTGTYYPTDGNGGAINPRNGDYYPRVAPNMVVDPKTGRVMVTQ